MELSEKTDIESLRDTILCGDALEILCSLPSESLQMCVTSPPYYGLRDYGVSGQIGSELSPHEYISRLAVVFREVRRILKKDGTLWLNIGDSYAGSGKGAWDKPIAERKKNKQIYHFFTTDSTSAIPKVWDGIKQKDMIGIPWMLAFALRSDGWYLRSDIIWEKPNCLPEPVKDRPTKSYEHLFLFAKSCRYYYDQMAIMEEVADSTVRRYKSGVSDTNKYDILELGSQLMPIGMLVVLDSIFNRITRNRSLGRETYIFIDEIYLLFQHEYSANFLFTLWKRVRKYGAFCTGITQNVDDLLQSHTARTMLANSEFVIMLNQGSTDRDDLANLLQISEDQMKYITDVEAGHGLIKVGSSLVPFERKFPKNTELFRLMTTKME